MNTLIAALSKYVIVALLTALLGTGGYAYYQHQKVAQLTMDVLTYKTAAADNLKAKEDADASCLITVGSLNSYYQNELTLSKAQQSTGDAVLTLPALTIKDKANDAPKPSTAPRYSDDDRLSPDTMRLLDAAYCYGDKDGCATPAK